MPGPYAYQKGREIEGQDYPFDAIIQAAMRKADSDNLAQLAHAFPEEYADLRARRNAPGGYLPGDPA